MGRAGGLSTSNLCAVASYIGQANLYMGNYDAAKKALKEVIDSSGKELLPFNEYAKMFNEDQEKFNRESILEINFRNGDTSGYFGMEKVLNMD